MLIRGHHLCTMQEYLNDITYHVNPTITNNDLNALFAVSWPHHVWIDFHPILERSLAYICSHASTQLIGFVNLAWDGGIHAFLLDTTVHPAWRRHGIGHQLVVRAVTVAREHPIQWLHVDYATHLDEFYRKCGFRPTLAGLIQL